jgi:DNA topoisomerase-6 subunit B
LGAYVKKRLKVKQQGERRQIFLRYLGEVATAVSEINAADRSQLYEQLLSVARRRTADADVKLDDRGRAIIEPEAIDAPANVLIVDPTEAPAAIHRAPVATEET